MSETGGSELNAVRTTELLRNRGHHVVALTLNAGTGSMRERYTSLGADVVEFRIPSLIGVTALRKMIDASRFLRRERIDVVQSHDCYTNFFMAGAARLARIPFVAAKRWTDYRLPQHRYTDYLAFSSASKVLANSPAVARSVSPLASVENGRVVVVPNYVDERVFDAGHCRDSLRASIGLPSSAFVFGIVAQIREEKNHPVLLRAFASLLQDTSKLADIRLLVVGDGDQMSAVKKLANEYGIEDRTVFVGHQQDAWRYFAAMEVAVLPSQHEGFPNALIEAMAAGTPVIASRVGGIPDAITHEETGLLVSPGNDSELATAMRSMRDDVAMRVDLAAHATSKARTEYTASAVLAKLEALYESLRRPTSPRKERISSQRHNITLVR